MTAESRYEYALISLNPDYMLDCVMEKLGALFQICSQYADMDDETIIKAFLASGLAEEFERQNSSVINGMSGIELAEEMLRRVGLEGKAAALPCICTTGLTPEHWIGQMVGYYQVTTGRPFRMIFSACPPKWLRAMAATLGEDTPESVAAEIDELVKRMRTECPLRTYRKQLGLTQAQLAKEIGVSARIIQQYEQGVKSINHASGVTLFRLSRLFGCRMEDLLEHPCV